MAGIFMSNHTGTEIDTTVNARPTVISRDQFSALDSSEVVPDKIYILSDDYSMRIANDSAWQTLNNIPYTQTVPTSDNTDNLKLTFITVADTQEVGFQYYAGWIYIIHNDGVTSSIKAKLGDGTLITIK